MPDTHDLGPIFVQSIWLQDDSPLFHLAPTFELESPYRESTSLVVRIPFSRRAIVVGWWRRTYRNEDEALRVAVGSVKVPIKSKYKTPTQANEAFPEISSMDMRAWAINRNRLLNTFRFDKIGNTLSWFRPLPFDQKVGQKLQIAREVPGTEVFIRPAHPNDKKLPERYVSYDGPFNLIDPTHKD